MNYPIKILPNSNYKLITCDVSNCYLIRFTHSNKIEDIFDEELMQVRQISICDPSGNMNDLSTSLLGVFETSFVQIELSQSGKEKYNSQCDPDISVEVPIFKKDFTINESRGFWVVLIGDINEKTIDYTKGGIDTKFKATCFIEHTPMKWNYWHFSIRWRTEEGFWHTLNDNQKKKMSKRLAHEARANIAKFAKIEEPNYTQLNHPDYCKL